MRSRILQNVFQRSSHRRDRGSKTVASVRAILTEQPCVCFFIRGARFIELKSISCNFAALRETFARNSGFSTAWRDPALINTSAWQRRLTRKRDLKTREPRQILAISVAGKFHVKISEILLFVAWCMAASFSLVTSFSLRVCLFLSLSFSSFSLLNNIWITSSFLRILELLPN